VSFRAIFRLFGAYIALVVGGALALHFSLTLDPSRSPRGPFVVTAWRDGVRTGRAVVPSNPERTLSSEREIPGTTLVVDRIVDEAPALESGSISFALSFLPGRDGLHVTFRGRDVYLTRDDLTHDALYRELRVGSADLGRRLDLGSVLARLGCELHASPDELFREGRFRRFVSTTSASTGRVPEATPSEATLTPSALALSAKRLAMFLSSRVDADGTVQLGDLVPRGTHYDWALHARLVETLADASRVLDDVKLRVAARRALRRLHDATTHCGGHECIGEGDVIDTRASVETLAADAKMAGSFRAQAFMEATKPLAEFVRSQQKAGGDFAPRYDVRAQKSLTAATDGSAELTARAVRALLFAYAFTHDEADLVAAQRGVASLVRTERLLLTRRPLAIWSAVCSALGDGARRGAPSAWGVERCASWALDTGRLQWSNSAPELAGGLAQSPFQTPETQPTAAFALGVVGILEAELGRSHDEERIRALALEAVKALAFLDRQALPGPRRYLARAAAFELGPVADGPLTTGASFESTESAANAMLAYLSLMEKRDPLRAKFGKRAKAPPPVH
jgi:hypothetical protein